MATSAIRQLLVLLLTTLIAAWSPASMAVSTGYQLIGLGLHQETGRDIYLGGIYLDENTSPPQDLQQLSAPRLMEYRVIARRTSIRSLLGSMLLQSEIATGRAPSAATSDFADALLSVVKGSLYAGDSLKIALTDRGETTANLNGHQLVRLPEAEVANYLLIGWLHENGPSTQFRSSLISKSINPGLLEKLEQHTYSAAREAEVAAWISPRQQPKKVADTQREQAPGATPPETAANTPIEPQLDTELAATTRTTEVIQVATEPPLSQPGATGAMEPDSTELALAAGQGGLVSTQVTIAEPEPLTLNLEPTLTQIDFGPSADTNSLAGMQTASLSLSSKDLGEISLDSEILSLGVREYSQRLLEFHGSMVSKVYRNIKYPKRAIRRNLQGRLELDITMRKSGELVAVSVAQSSGHQILDAAAVAAAESAMASGNIAALDIVAVAEFGNSDNRVVVPIPVNFQLQ